MWSAYQSWRHLPLEGLCPSPHMSCTSLHSLPQSLPSALTAHGQTPKPKVIRTQRPELAGGAGLSTCHRPIRFSCQSVWPPRKVAFRDASMRGLLMPGCDWRPCCAGHKLKDTRSQPSEEGYWKRRAASAYFPSAPGCPACPLLESHKIPMFFPSGPGCLGAV